MSKMNGVNRVLVIAPHTDDIELGCGGTVAKLLNMGVSVYYVVYSLCELSVPEGLPKDILKKECQNAVKALGIPASNLYMRNFPVREFPKHRQEILEDMIVLRKEIKPDLVIFPNSNDVHQDHHTIHIEGVRAFKKSKLLGYELPWNDLVSDKRFFMTLTEEEIDVKVKALQAYESQKFRVYFSDNYIKSLAFTKGVQLGHSEYAECFELIRWYL